MPKTKRKNNELLHKIEDNLNTPQQQDHIKMLLEDNNYDIELVKSILMKEISVKGHTKNSLKNNFFDIKNQVDIKFVSSKFSYECFVVFGNQVSKLKRGEHFTFKKSKLEQIFAIVFKNNEVSSGLLSEMVDCRNVNNISIDVLKFEIRGSLPKYQYPRMPDIKLQSLISNLAIEEEIFVKTDTAELVLLCDLVRPNFNFNLKSIEEAIKITNSLQNKQSKGCSIFSIFFTGKASPIEKSCFLTSCFINLGIDAYVGFNRTYFIILRGEPDVFLDFSGKNIKVDNVKFVFNDKHLCINIQNSPKFDFDNPLRWFKYVPEKHIYPSMTHFIPPSANTAEIENIWTHHISRIIMDKHSSIISLELDNLLGTLLESLEDQRDITKFSNFIKGKIPPDTKFYGIHHSFENEISQTYEWLISNHDVQQLYNCHQIFIKVKAFNYVGNCVKIRVFLGGM
eukprot:NODE_26_length_40862_cov_0.679513.p9 type:complete len:453 gc:universal NODE_26_length_40862_cov_0.679513:35911-37269(+)